jgi:hypothetical protein
MAKLPQKVKFKKIENEMILKFSIARSEGKFFSFGKKSPNFPFLFECGAKSIYRGRIKILCISYMVGL